MTAIRFLGAAAAAALLGSAQPASCQVATGMMVGRWKGNAEIFSSWTVARTLPVDIRIGPEDRVTGTIGDAQLVDGKFERNRNRVEAWLHVKTEYRIVGRLEGAIIAAESISRATVSLPLNWRDGYYTGGVATSGSKVGGAESSILSAGRLTLRRTPDLVVCERPRMRGRT